MMTPADFYTISIARDGDVAFYIDVEGFSEVEPIFIDLSERLNIYQGTRKLVDSIIPEGWMKEATITAPHIFVINIENPGRSNQVHTINAKTKLRIKE